MKPLRPLLATCSVIAVLFVPAQGVGAEVPEFNTECDSLGDAGTPFVRGVNCRVVEIDGYPREYIVYLPHSPAFDPAKETPVVFHYHGTGGRAEGTLEESQWAEKAEKARFVAVFGSGLTYFECAAPGFCDAGEYTTKWHNFSLTCDVVDCDIRPPGYPPEGEAPWPADDVAFTDAMLLDVRAGLDVDPRRTYLSGFSNGGGMVLRLAIDRSLDFAAAGVAGPGRDEVYDAPRSVPLYYAMGSLDGRMLGDVNRSDLPDPELEEFPLIYDELFAYPSVATRFDNLTASHGVSNVPNKVWEFHDELRIRYATPLDPLDDGAEVIVSFQKDVRHEFANADENPEEFHNPDIFWKWFHDHPLGP